jgi:hypothetical protein
MTEVPERRRVRRAVATGRLTGHASLTVEFRLLDLSPTGARIEHLALLRPGSRCTLQLPAPSGSLVLAAQIVWTTVVGREQIQEGTRLLRYHSDLMFLGLSTGAASLQAPPDLSRGLAANPPCIGTLATMNLWVLVL